MAAAKGHAWLVAAALGLLISGGAHAETKKTIRINGVSYDAEKSDPSTLDKNFRLKKLLLFPTVDDVSGTLAPQLDEEVAAALLSFSRFEVVRDAKVIRALSPDDAGYPKISGSDAVHKEAATVVNADGTVILRTKTNAGNIELTMEWRSADGVICFQEQSKVPAFASNDVRQKQLRLLVDSIVKKIPFRGTVTGRTGAVVTVDLGRKEVKQGDLLILARLTGLQRHPLLKTVIQADYSKVGVARVTSVDKVMAFAKIEEERTGEAVAANNKVMAVEADESWAPSRETTQPSKASDDEKFRIKNSKEEEERLTGALDRPFPQYGFAGMDLGYGSLTHEQTESGATTNITGSGIAAALNGELWITRSWVGGGGYAFHNATLTGTRSGATVEAGSASWKRLWIFGGYRLFPMDSEGLSVLFGGGYNTVSVEIPASSANALGGKDYSGLLFRVGVDVPMDGKNKIGADLDFMPFGSVTDKSVSLGTSSGANLIGISAGWHHELFPNLWGKVGLKYEQASATYVGGPTASARHFVFGPGVLYYF